MQNIVDWFNELDACHRRFYGRPCADNLAWLTTLYKQCQPPSEAAKAIYIWEQAERIRDKPTVAKPLLDESENPVTLMVTGPRLSEPLKIEATERSILDLCRSISETGTLSPEFTIHIERGEE